MDKKKIGAGFAGALQKAADATKAAKLAVQDMAADAKQSREKRKAAAQKAAAAKELIAVRHNWRRSLIRRTITMFCRTA